MPCVSGEIHPAMMVSPRHNGLLVTVNALKLLLHLKLTEESLTLNSKNMKIGEGIGLRRRKQGLINLCVSLSP